MTHSFPQMNPMSEAEFWWNHLTYAQRAFIAHTDKFTELYDTNEPLMIDLTEQLYKQREYFHSLPGWPETPMRKV